MSTYENRDVSEVSESNVAIAGFCTFFAWFWGALAFVNLFIINGYYIPLYGDCLIDQRLIPCDGLGDVRNPEVIVITVALVCMTYLTMTAIFAALSAILKKP